MLVSCKAESVEQLKPRAGTRKHLGHCHAMKHGSRDHFACSFSGERELGIKSLRQKLMIINKGHDKGLVSLANFCALPTLRLRSKLVDTRS